MKDNKVNINRIINDIVIRKELNMMNIVQQYYITKTDKYNKDEIVLILRESMTK